MEEEEIRNKNTNLTGLSRVGEGNLVGGGGFGNAKTSLRLAKLRTEFSLNWISLEGKMSIFPGRKIRGNSLQPRSRREMKWGRLKSSSSNSVSRRATGGQAMEIEGKTTVKQGCG